MTFRFGLAALVGALFAGNFPASARPDGAFPEGLNRLREVRRLQAYGPNDTHIGGQVPLIPGHLRYD